MTTQLWGKKVITPFMNIYFGYNQIPIFLGWGDNIYNQEDHLLLQGYAFFGLQNGNTAY